MGIRKFPRYEMQRYLVMIGSFGIQYYMTVYSERLCHSVNSRTGLIPRLAIIQQNILRTISNTDWDFKIESNRRFRIGS